MTTTTQLRVRRSIISLQKDYENGIKQPLEDLMRAWKGIKELPPEDEHSFFRLGGYHGEPFQYRRAVDALPAEDAYAYWGGYCNHGNVLFPTWHRVYVLKVEEALQSIVPGVMLPYWDQSDNYSLEHGIPSVLTQEKFTLDGVVIDNPLRSFVLPLALSDHLGSDERLYEKPAGYETVRYPLSGLVGTAEARSATGQHNALYPDFATNTALLNNNLQAWLRGPRPSKTDRVPQKSGVYVKLQECLNAPNYTVFSNTTSAAQWNLISPGKVTSLESPHNSIHLAVGGYDITGSDGKQTEFGIVEGSNGDMGENNTAAMDPIFFFHHCNIDRMFWLWQKRHEATHKLEIIEGFAGTTASDSQGPTPGYSPAATLNLESALNPFRKADGSAYISNDCVNIETQLGFTYEPGSLDENFGQRRLFKAADVSQVRKLHVSGINRTAVQGSFFITAYAELSGDDGQPYRHDLGHTAVLSRFNVVKCANCLTHADVMAHFPLSGLSPQQLQQAEFHVFLHTRTGVIPLTLGQQPQTRQLFKAAAPLRAGKPIDLRIID
jgi:tyrosinase